VNLTTRELEIEESAITFAKTNRSLIAARVTDPKIFQSEQTPVSVFMAGSPGAGKTEASKALISEITKERNDILRIDPDELRDQFSAYEGNNSYLFHRAVSILVERIHDRALKQNQSFVLDGTLSKYEKAEDNINRSLTRNRPILILYVYQNPLLAWQFVKARERVEGRRIVSEHFVDQYFGARDTVDRLKQHFGKRIEVDLLIKEIDNTVSSYKANIDKIDNHLPEKYDRAELEKQLLKL
jgi:predicted ABC-type ATPase